MRVRGKGIIISTLAALILSTAMSTGAMAQARPIIKPIGPAPVASTTHAANDNVPNAIKGYITYKAGQQGIPANDNRIAIATNAAMDTLTGGLTTAVIGVGTFAAGSVVVAGGVASAPAWITAGIIALVTVGVAGGISWLMNGGFQTVVAVVTNPTTGDPELQKDALGNPIVTPSTQLAMAPVVAGQPALSNCQPYVSGGNYVPNCNPVASQAGECTAGNVETLQYCTAQGYNAYAAEAFPSNPEYLATGIVDLAPDGLGRARWQLQRGDGSLTGIHQQYAQTQAPGSCTGFISRGVCTPAPDPSPGVSQSLSLAQQSVPTGYYNAPMNNAAIAAIVDSAWSRAAAKPGYAGVPYVSPVTEADIAEAIRANPALQTSLRDWLSPSSAQGTWSNPGPATKPGTAPATYPNPATNPANVTVNVPAIDYEAMPGSATNPAKIDWGNFGASDPTPPEMTDVLEPLLTLFPEMRNKTFTKTGSCPDTIITVFEGGWQGIGPDEGLTMDLSAACDFTEQNRALIQAIMSFLWIMTAFRIFMSA